MKNWHVVAAIAGAFIGGVALIYFTVGKGARRVRTAVRSLYA